MANHFKATLTSRGRVTIPARVRQSLGLSAGDRVEFLKSDDGQFVLIAAMSSVRTLKGLIRSPGKPVSIRK